jgi:hypothetical protein
MSGLLAACSFGALRGATCPVPAGRQEGRGAARTSDGTRAEGDPMKRAHHIIGVHVTDRVQNVPDMQRVFTEFGCYIKTRIGLHEVHDDFCSPNGMIVLDMICGGDTCQQMMDKLSAVEGLEVQKMTFEHD